MPKLLLPTSSGNTSPGSASDSSDTGSDSDSGSVSGASSFSFGPSHNEKPLSRSSAVNLSAISSNLTLLNRIDDLKSKVSSSYRSMEIAGAEEDLRSQILEFQVSLTQIRDLHTQCGRMLSSFVAESDRSATTVNKQLAHLREQMSGFTILDSLEDRIEKVQSIIESRTKKLGKINEWVAEQEDILVIKRKRLQRIWKIALITSIIGLFLMITLYFFINFN